MRTFLCSFLLLWTITTYAQSTCFVTISASDDGCSVYFSGYLSAGGSATSWEWDFGDGHRAYQESYTHTYSSNGTYQVSLTVSSSDSCTATETYEVTVTNCQQCDANFSWSNYDCDVSFSDFSLAYAEVVSWSWYFGDGSTSNEQSPHHTYADDGDYQVSLDIVTSDNCTATISKLVSVSGCVQTCSADFSYDNYNGCEVSFMEYAAIGNGTISSWNWDFGDGHSSQDQSPVHHYGDNGSYTVTLSITTDDGCTDTQSQTITVDNCSSYCSADFSYDNYNGCEVSFTEYASSSYGSIVSWAWDFGDGNTSSDQNPTHHYGDNGSYTVSLSITADDGCTDTQSQTITVDNCSSYCSAEFSYDNYNGCEVSFTEYASSSYGSIVSWAWDFGDGNTSSDQNPTHQYGDNGSYTVSLSITTDDGCTDTQSQDLTVDSCSHCYADFSYQVDADSVCKLHFHDQSTSYDSITYWYWNFGDGNTSTYRNPVHRYAHAGYYTVKLQITTAYGCTDEKSHYIYVDSCGYDCKALFTPVQESACTFRFQDESRSYYPIVSWHWSFGDGKKSTVRNPRHTYAKNGQYQVQLVITAQDNCKDTLVKTVSVTQCQPPCRAEYQYRISQQLVYFHDRTKGEVVSWFWEFGDGSVSRLRHPIHYYTRAGVYPVRLTIRRKDGCTDDFTRKVLIRTCEQHCRADFAYDAEPGCMVEFADYSIGSGGIRFWSWDFGDGSQAHVRNPRHFYAQGGTYQIQLAIQTVEGCRDTIQHEITVDGCEPEAETPETESQQALDIQSGNKLPDPADEGQLASASLGEWLHSPVQLFPNPTRGSLLLEADFSEALDLRWEIVDLRGKQVLAKVLPKGAQQIKEKIEMSELASGVYFFQLVGPEGLLYRAKVMKQ